MAGLREDVEKRLYELLSDLTDRIGVERVQQLVEGAFVGAARTKEVVDKNVESILSFANIPSRREYERMKTKLDALQGTILNLTRTVEELQARLAERNENGAGSSAKRKAPATSRAHKSTTAKKKPTRAGARKRR